MLRSLVIDASAPRAFPVLRSSECQALCNDVGAPPCPTLLRISRLIPTLALPGQPWQEGFSDLQGDQSLPAAGGFWIISSVTPSGSTK